MVIGFGFWLLVSAKLTINTSSPSPEASAGREVCVCSPTSGVPRSLGWLISTTFALFLFNHGYASVLPMYDGMESICVTARARNHENRFPRL